MGAFALSILVRDLPEQHPKREAVVQLAKSFYAAVLKHQNEDGMWHQEMTDEDSYVETSGSGLLLYGLGIMIEKGQLDPKYKQNIEPACAAIWPISTRMVRSVIPARHVSVLGRERKRTTRITNGCITIRMPLDRSSSPLLRHSNWGSSGSNRPSQAHIYRQEPTTRTSQRLRTNTAGIPKSPGRPPASFDWIPSTADRFSSHRPAILFCP